jgi:hypothetical protein
LPIHGVVFLIYIGLGRVGLSAQKGVHVTFSTRTHRLYFIVNSAAHAWLERSVTLEVAVQTAPPPGVAVLVHFGTRTPPAAGILLKVVVNTQALAPIT